MVQSQSSCRLSEQQCSVTTQLPDFTAVCVLPMRRKLLNAHINVVVERTELSEESTIQMQLENDNKPGGCFKGFRNIHTTITSVLYQIWYDCCRCLWHITWTCKTGKHTLGPSTEYKHKIRMYELSCPIQHIKSLQVENEELKRQLDQSKPKSSK